MALYSLSCINEIIQYTLSGPAILNSFSQTCCSLLNNQNVWSSIGGGRLRFEVDNAPLYSRALNRPGRTLITLATPLHRTLSAGMHRSFSYAAPFQLRTHFQLRHTLLPLPHSVSYAYSFRRPCQLCRTLLATPHPVSYAGPCQLRHNLLFTSQDGYGYYFEDLQEFNQFFYMNADGFLCKPSIQLQSDSSAEEGG